MTVANNDFSRASYMPVRIKGIMPHGANYWRDKGVTEPARDDYVYHVEFNHIHDYGEGILSDFGGIYMGKSKYLGEGGAPLNDVRLVFRGERGVVLQHNGGGV